MPRCPLAAGRGDAMRRPPSLKMHCADWKAPPAAELGEGSRQPRTVVQRTSPQVMGERVEGHPAPVLDLVRVGRRRLVALAPEQVVVFVLDQPLSDWQPIQEGAGEVQRTVDPHLLTETPRCSGDGTLARLWVPAGSVRPRATTVVLPRGTPLEQQLPRCVEDEGRHRAVQKTEHVCAHLLLYADLPIVSVHQHNVWCRHRLSPRKRGRV